MINKKQQFILGDCLNEMNNIADNTIDLVFTDLPYGTTNISWDKKIPLNDFVIINNKVYNKETFFLKNYQDGISFDQTKKEWGRLKKSGLWRHYNRIIKPNGCILLFSQAPYTAELINSNLKSFKYEWIWEKTQATGYLNAKKMPLKAHENILVFYKKLPTYNPIKTKGHIRKISSSKSRAKCIERRYNTDDIYNKEDATKIKTYDSTQRYPRTVKTFKSDKQKSSWNKTQKPIELLKYFIKTYSNENDLILDSCAGSGSTAIACHQTDRNFICIEKNTFEYNKMLERFSKEKNVMFI